MKRKEIEETYQIGDGGRFSAPVITSPGKFEGEPIYVPYFWDEYLEFGADEDQHNILVFIVNEEDRDQFPELKVGDRIGLIQDDQGFIHELFGNGS